MTRLMQDIAIGNWYRMGSDAPFEIVAVDPDNETIDIQHFDGTVEEIEFESWLEMPIVLTAEPEDYSGALDIEREDYGMDMESLNIDDWSNPLDQLDRIENHF